MVIVCSAPGCSAKKDSVNSKSSVQFHRFPLRKPDILAKWVKAIKSPTFKPTVTSYLCSAHFAASDYDLKPSSVGKHLKPTAVPSFFEKKKPGRKKKFLGETEAVVDEKNNDKEFNEEKEPETAADEQYLEVRTNDKVQSNLAEIIGDQEKGTLHVLVVGEDGKITNSGYIFRKELDSDDETKMDSDALPSEEVRDSDEDNISHLKEKGSKNDDSPPHMSSRTALFRYKDLKNREKIKNLESTLLLTKKKVKVLQMKCNKMNKRINELQFLLKLLVLKRGKGDKNLKQLLEEYENLEEETIKIEVKKECEF